MKVIKLGGSLAATGKLQQCLDKIEHSDQDRAVVIVPGGGVFAEQVRIAQQQWQFDDRTAHRMAILAMQQMALLFNALKPGFILVGSISGLRNQGQQRRIIWMPNVAELDQAGIPSSWEITSDSLAAWLANSLQAEELILVKSVNIETNVNMRKLIEDQVVDSSFCEFTRQASFKIRIVNAETFVS